MLFRAPGKSNPFQYSNTNPYQIIPQNNQKSMITFNNSFTAGQKCLSQQKLCRNNDQRFYNYQATGIVLKTEPTTQYQQIRYRPPSYYKSPTSTEFTRVTSTLQNNSILSIQQECLILRREKSQLSEKMKKVQEELQSKDNLIQGKQKQIEQLKIIHSQSVTAIKPNQNDNISQIKKQKQKLYFQVIQLQAELHKMQEKYEKMQKQHYSLTAKYDDLQSKSTQNQSRKFKREQMLESELSLAQKKNQRLKTQYERQLASLKDKVKELEESNFNKSAVYAYNAPDNYSPIKFPTQSEPELSCEKFQKLQHQLLQKSQMIKYLQMQCAKKRDAKDGRNEAEINRLNNLYEQSRKQFSRILMECDNIKKENGVMSQKLGKAQKLCEEYKKQVKDLEYLLREIKNKEYRSNVNSLNDQNRTIAKIERQRAQKYENKIKDLELQIKRISNLPKLQAESVQKRHERLIEQQRIKNQAEITIKNQQIKDFSNEKQKLLDKVEEYRSLLKVKDEKIYTIEEEKNKLRAIEEERKAMENKISEELNNNMMSLQKQLKSKVEELFMIESTKISLEKQVVYMRKSFEERMAEMISTVTKFDAQNKKLIKEKETLKLEIEKLKGQNAQKMSKQVQEQKLEIQQKYGALLKENEDKYNFTVKNYQQQNNKLKSIIEQTNTNNKNEKKKYEQLQQQCSKLKQQNNQLKLEYSQLQAQLQYQLQSQLQQQLSSNQSKIKQLEQIIQTIKNQLAIKIKQLQQKNTDLQQKQQYTFKLQSELAEWKTKYQNSLENNSKNNETINELEAKMDEKQNKMRQLQENIKKTRIQQKDNAEMKMNELKTELQEKYKELQLKIKEKQNEIQIKDKKIEEIQLRNMEKQDLQGQIEYYQHQLAAIQTQTVGQTQQIKMLRKIVKEQEVSAFEIRENLKEKEEHSKQIEAQLEELTTQLMQLRNKVEEVEIRRIKSNVQGQQQQKSLKMSKVSNLSGESFVADYIEIDKNALLYICDMLGIEPEEGQILKSIIDFIQNSQHLKIQTQYKQILELFGVDVNINEKTQEKLIGQIKIFRTTITGLLQKVTILEMRNDSLLKDNRQMNRQIGKMQIKNIQLQRTLNMLNQELMKIRLIGLNVNYKSREKQQETGSQETQECKQE